VIHVTELQRKYKIREEEEKLKGAKRKGNTWRVAVLRKEYGWKIARCH
jgi:hypothetical protein